MAAIQGHHKPHPKAPKCGAYQSDIYKRGMFENVVPTVTTDPNKLEAQTKEAMTSEGTIMSPAGRARELRWTRTGWLPDGER